MMNETSRKTRPRVGPKELSQLNQIFEFTRPEGCTTKRISTRIRFKNKLKAFSSMNSIKSNAQSSHSNKSMDEMIKTVSNSIANRNPADKILLMRILGLTPTSDIHQTTDGGGFKESFDVVATIQSTKDLKSENPKRNSLTETQNEDLEDLDLEIVFCPLDCPEIYEEIMKRPFPFNMTDSKNINELNYPKSKNKVDQLTNDKMKYKCWIPETKLFEAEKSNHLKLNHGFQVKVPLSPLSNSNFNQESNLTPQLTRQRLKDSAVDYFENVKTRLGLLGTDIDYADHEQTQICRPA